MRKLSGYLFSLTLGLAFSKAHSQPMFVHNGAYHIDMKRYWPNPQDPTKIIIHEIDAKGPDGKYYPWAVSRYRKDPSANRIFYEEYDFPNGKNLKWLHTWNYQIRSNGVFETADQFPSDNGDYLYANFDANYPIFWGDYLRHGVSVAKSVLSYNSYMSGKAGSNNWGSHEVRLTNGWRPEDGRQGVEIVKRR